MNINVAFGYLSVLLGYLSLNAVIKDRVCLQLRGGTLRKVLDSIEEFLHYHKEVAEETVQADQDIEPKINFVIRVEKMVDCLKR